MQQFAQFLLYLAFAVTLGSALISYLGGRFQNTGWVRAGRLGLYSSWILFVVMSVILLYSLVTHDFTNKYVASYTDVRMPTGYLVAAFWGGEKGALLFWATMLSGFGCLAIYQNRHRDPTYMAYTTGTLLLAIFFFSLLMVFESSPFETFMTHGGPADGKGMNPQLQNPTMTIHPPSLLTGYIAFTIPFAFGLGALLSGKLDDAWAKDSRVWTIVCWIFLTLGLILGGLWSYEEIGWGGYWAWDPVENAGLIPWFTATAFLHSVMIQERRAMLRRWNFFLVVLTFLLTIFGTFLTRSQLIDSIHAFADSTLAGYFLWYMGVISIVGFGALAYRWKEMRPDSRIEYFLSRESFFVLNNILLLGCAFIVLWGTVFSKVSETEWVQQVYNGFIDYYNMTPLATWFGDGVYLTQALNLGAPWFNRVMVPAGLVLLLLSGIGPIISWRRATRKNFEKNFRLPLALAGLTVGISCTAWSVFRVFQVRAMELDRLSKGWVDSGSAWAHAAVNGEGPISSFPGIPAFSLSEAYAKWTAGLGSDDFFVVLAVFFCAFVTATIFIEFFRGARILQRKHGGGLSGSMTRLLMNNRRRYGGYIIHLGVVLAYVAFAGNVFLEKKEQNIKFGESTSVGNYHVTLLELNEEMAEKGAYLASRASIVVMEEGTTVPSESVGPIVAQLQEADLEPFQVETYRHRPYVEVRFVDRDARRRVREGLFLDHFFRETFNFVGIGSTGKSASFRVKNMEVVQLMPMVMHRWMTQSRQYFHRMKDGTNVKTTPGSPVFEIRFADEFGCRRFVEAFQGEPLVKDVFAGRYDDEDEVALLMPEGVGTMMYPEVRYYRKHDQPTTEVAIDSHFSQDFYLAMRTEHPGQLHAKMLVLVYPLVSFLWIGALVMLIGGIICLLPSSLVRGFRTRTASETAGWLIVMGFGAATLIAGNDVRAQVHVAPEEIYLPRGGGVDEWSEVEGQLYDAVGCPEDRSGRRFRLEQTLGTCETQKAADLRQHLLDELAVVREENPRVSAKRAVDLVLIRFVEEDPRHENGLRHEVWAKKKLMDTTNCYCGCGSQKSLAQCGLDCGNAKFWGTRFQVLLSEGYSLDEIRSAYLETRNASLGPGERQWTMEDVVVDSQKGITWMVPFVSVLFAVLVFSFLLMRVRRGKRAMAGSADAASPAATSGQKKLSDAERQAVQDELDDYL